LERKKEGLLFPMVWDPTKLGGKDHISALGGSLKKGVIRWDTI